MGCLKSPSEVGSLPPSPPLITQAKHGEPAGVKGGEDYVKKQVNAGTLAPVFTCFLI